MQFIAELPELHLLLARHPLVLVFFYTDWSAACKSIFSYFRRRAADAQICVAQCNADQAEDFAVQLAVDRVPSFLVFSRSATAVARFTGNSQKIIDEAFSQAQRLLSEQSNGR